MGRSSATFMSSSLERCAQEVPSQKDDLEQILAGNPDLACLRPASDCRFPRINRLTLEVTPGFILILDGRDGSDRSCRQTGGRQCGYHPVLPKTRSYEPPGSESRWIPPV